MKKVYIYLADGFEEAEALVPADMLRRAGIEAILVSITDNTIVTGARGIKVVADCVIADADIADADMIMLPGGYPGFENLANSVSVMEAIRFMSENDRYIAAICGAPAIVLGKNGYLKDKRAVCYPGMEDDLNCKHIYNNDVCIDGNIITAKAAACALEFAFAIIQCLCGDNVAEKVKKSVVYHV